MEKKPLKITETVLRDAHQSLMATRLTTEQMLPIIDKMDKVGYHAVECWGGATFDASLRFLKEDPWERLRKFRDGFKNTKLQMLFRGQNILGYRHYADDVVEYFVQKSIANGIDIIRIFDCLNDLRNLKTAVDGLKVMGVRGFNLTMPDKNLMCSLVDKLSPASEIGGAVNTVVNDNGVLTGYTTDGIGFMRAVSETGVDIIGKKMTLLGAGGAAAAILIQAALDKVAEISVFNIRDEFFTRAEKTIEKLHEKTDCKINLYDFSDPEVLKKEIAESAILVNGTSIGMAPKTDRCIITDDSVFRKDLFVFDVIYNPEETLFLKKAKAAGCQTLNGLNMLLYQGAASFELWTGKEMPVDIIKEKYFSR